MLKYHSTKKLTHLIKMTPQNENRSIQSVNISAANQCNLSVKKKKKIILCDDV